jgi:endonuclease I
VFSALGGPPPGYYNPALGKTGSELRQALHEIINDHTILAYSSGTNNTEVALKVLDQDPANINNVLLLYELRSEPKTNFGTTLGWNREHQWCNSYGLDDVPPAYTDLFNLRAEDATVNSARNNKFYDISDTNNPNYHKPGHAEAPLTSTDSDSWEPPDAVKGDIARALFYMDVRYEGDRTNEPNLVLREITDTITTSNAFMGRLSTMLLWNQQDPVDAAEQLRNDLIYERYQHNRNPFIDHPEWVDLIFKPQLRIVRAGETVQIFWPSEFTNGVLNVSATVTGPWTDGTGLRTIIGNEVRETESGANAGFFFRLTIR